MKMDCKRFERNINAYVDGALSSTLHVAMQTHAASCPACRREMESLMQMGNVLHDAVPVPPVPEGFAGRVMARAAAIEASAPIRLVAWLPSFEWWQEMARPTRAAAVLAVGLALGAIMGWDANRNGLNPPPVVAKADTMAAYNLDYLGDAPAGSLAQVVMTLDR